MKIHHIAIQVDNIKECVSFYCNKFNADIEYEDETWAMLNFDNIQLALVIPEEHPPHICFEKTIPKNIPAKEHRDGTRSVYDFDPSGNMIEYLEPAKADSKQLELKFET